MHETKYAALYPNGKLGEWFTAREQCDIQSEAAGGKVVLLVGQFDDGVLVGVEVG